MDRATNLKVALLGTPNSGKSSLFNRLTGMSQRTGNFPGVTVERKSATLVLPNNRQATLTDLPGTYTLYPNGEEERITCEVVRNPQHPDHPDLLVVVVDATQLKRGMILVSQIIDWGIPLVVAVNMSDLIEKEGISLQIDLLAQRLQTPVIALSGLTGAGVKELKAAIAQTPTAATQRIFVPPLDLERYTNTICQWLGTQNSYRAFQALAYPRDFARLSPDQIRQIQAWVSPEQATLHAADEMLLRYDRTEALLQGVLSNKPSASEKLTNQLDRILLHRFAGYTIFGIILLLIFQAIFTWASYPADLIESAFGNLMAWLVKVLPQAWWSNLFINGIVAGLGGIVVFIPQIAFLFFFIALLEESGYMSRVIFLLDRLMRPFGLSGRAIVPLIGGMACAVPSIMMARSIPNPFERLIAIMVTPLMSCSARIPIYILLISMFVPDIRLIGFFSLQGLVMGGMYILGFVTALIAAAILKKYLGYDTSGTYIAELPIYRMPNWKNAALMIYQKCKSFVLEAGKVIMIISVLLWFLASYGPGNRFAQIDAHHDTALQQVAATDSTQIAAIETARSSEKIQNSYAGIIGHTIEPLIRPLGFDWKIGIALLTSFAAREVFVGTMATIYSVSGWDEDNPKPIIERMRAETNPATGKPVYTPAVGFALLVFYAFAMQCMSTLAVTRRETGSWKWAVLMLVYMTILAYAAAWVVYRIVGSF